LQLSVAALLGVAGGCTSSQPLTDSSPVVAVAPLAEQAAQAHIAELQETDRVQSCLLGTSCMELDEEPFEVCLLGSDKCPSNPEVLQATESGTAGAQPNTSLERTRER
jgi:hypothetical protein